MKIVKSKFTSSLISVAFLIAVVYSPVVQAEPAEKGRGLNKGLHIFSVYDSDKDGFLSRSEYRNFVEHIEIKRKAKGKPEKRYKPPLNFDEIDTDGDGYISEDEMISALNKRLQKHRRYRYKGGQW